MQTWTASLRTDILGLMHEDLPPLSDLPGGEMREEKLIANETPSSAFLGDPTNSSKIICSPTAAVTLQLSPQARL